MTAPRANTTEGTHVKVLELLLQEGTGRVLDAPAGQGALSQELRNAGFEPHAVECDVDQFKLDDVPLTSCDLNGALPFADDSFDAAACVDGIEHLENPFALIRELHRIVRPGGSVVISTPNIMALRSRARFLFSGFHHKFKMPLDETRPAPAHHINPLTLQELRYALHSTGFEITAIAANRIKWISYLYILLVPFAFICTKLAFRHEKNPAQRSRNREIFRTLFSAPVLLGETLIIKARKKEAQQQGNAQ